MTTFRLPKTKYLRQLRDMDEDLSWWTASYLEAANSTTSDHLAGRFAGRAAVLGDALRQIRELRDTLYGLPRLS